MLSDPPSGILSSGISGIVSSEYSYIEAKEEYDKGYLMDAANNIFLSSSVANPANQFWQYQNQDEMKSFYEKVMAELNSKYQFPMTLEGIDSKPQILSVSPQGTAHGYYPMIEYLTTIDLGDTLAIKAECEKVHSEIVKAFKGIDKDKKYIFYRAFNEIPNGKTLVRTHGFVKELK